MCNEFVDLFSALQPIGQNDIVRIVRQVWLAHETRKRLPVRVQQNSKIEMSVLTGKNIRRHGKEVFITPALHGYAHRA
jgi:hypothetical protein